MRFEELDFDNQFDGIWACASLLHVSRSDTPLVFEKFIGALKPQGVWYVVTVQVPGRGGSREVVWGGVSGQPRWFGAAAKRPCDWQV